MPWRKQAVIRGFPNGETLSGKAGKSSAEFIGGAKRTQGSEPSQYLEEEKAISDSESSGERNRNSLNPALHGKHDPQISQMDAEGKADPSRCSG